MEITPKFKGVFLISWETLSGFQKIFAGGRHEITHVNAKILFSLWDKSTYLVLENCRTDFHDFSYNQRIRPDLSLNGVSQGFVT